MDEGTRMEIADFDDVVRQVLDISPESMVAQLAISACIVSLDDRSPYTEVLVKGYPMPWWRQKILEAWVYVGITTALYQEAEDNG